MGQKPSCDISHEAVDSSRTRNLWVFKFQTDKQLLADQPDAVVVEKEKMAVMIDVAIPADGNIRKKEHEKSDRYKGL